MIWFLGKSVKHTVHDNLRIFQPFTTQYPLLTTLKKKLVENIVGKGENAGCQHFLLFPQCFQPYQKQKSAIQLLLKLSSANALIWSKFLWFGKKLNALLRSSII